MRIKPLLLIINIAFMLSGCGAGELKKTAAYLERELEREHVVECEDTTESCLGGVYHTCNGSAYTIINFDYDPFSHFYIASEQKKQYKLTFKCDGGKKLKYPKYPRLPR